MWSCVHPHKEKSTKSAKNSCKLDRVVRSSSWLTGVCLWLTNVICLGTWNSKSLLDLHKNSHPSIHTFLWPKVCSDSQYSEFLCKDAGRSLQSVLYTPNSQPMYQLYTHIATRDAPIVQVGLCENSTAFDRSHQKPHLLFSPSFSLLTLTEYIKLWVMCKVETLSIPAAHSRFMSDCVFPLTLCWTSTIPFAFCLNHINAAVSPNCLRYYTLWTLCNQW